MLQQENQQNQTEEQPDNSALNQQQELEVPVTNSPPANSQPQPKVFTEEQVRTIHELYGQTLRENEQRLQQLQAQIQQSQNNQQQHNPQDDDFLSNGRNIVGEEIDRRLQPFANWMQQQQVQSVYSQLKEQFRKHPTFSAFFNIPQAEMLLDQQVSQMPPANVNTQSVAGLISQIYGYMQLNNMIPQALVVTNQQQQFTPNIQQPAPQQPINQPTNNMPTPPHLRPSAPPMPTNNGQNLTPKGNVRRQLTELERRVARENRLSEDDYIDYLNESPTNVYKSDIGQQRNG
jgi:hypothetical protein